MSTPVLYDTLHSFKDIHKVVLNLPDGLNDEQFNWKPEGTADGFWFGNGEKMNVIASPFALSGRLRRSASKPTDEARAKQSPINRLEALNKITRL